MSRLLLHYDSHLKLDDRLSVLRAEIDLEPGARSMTSVFALSAKENLMAARWKSAAWQSQIRIALPNRRLQFKHIYGSTE